MVGEMEKRKCEEAVGLGIQLENRRTGKQETGLHAQPGFVTPDGASAHFHATNGLFGGVVGPRDLGF
jgi:hypothetical protein